MSETVRSITQSQRLVRGVTAVIVILVLASGLAMWHSRTQAIRATEEDNHRLGAILAEQITRSFQAVDLVLRQVVDKVAASGVRDPHALHDSFGGRDLHEALAKHLLDLPQAEAFTVVDSAGYLVNTSRQWPPPSYSLAERDEFRYLAATPNPGPFVSHPGTSLLSSAPSVFLARRLTAADGSFLGVVVAPILLDDFRNFFTESGFTGGRSVTLLRGDGSTLLRVPAWSVPPGAETSQTPNWRDIVAAGGGAYLSPGAVADATPSYVSVHVLRQFPLVVNVTRDQASTLAPWRRQAVAIGLGVLAAAVSVALLLHALSRHIALMNRQIVALEASEAQVVAQSTQLATTLDHMEQGIIMVDGNGTVAIYNQRALEILGLPAELLAKHPRFVEIVEYQISNSDFPNAPDGLPSMDAYLSPYARYERRRSNGTVIEVRSAPVADGGMVRTYTDVTARTAADEMLGVAASQDHLTGLLNRNGFCIGLEAAFTAAQHAKTKLAVLCLNLDGFKTVNDTLGYSAGDQVLIQVAERLRGQARATDLIGRLGSDEFAVALPGADLSGAEQTCHRLLDLICMPYAFAGGITRIGVSVGVTIYPDDASGVEHMLNNADRALRAAKAGGRNTWRAFANVDGAREHQRMQLEQDLRAAVEARQFSLAYQPIFETATGEPMGFEALLRWTHPETGSISPAEFIPIAEQTGLILPLGRWVIETACAEAATWAMPLHVAVNLSPAQFRDRDLPAFIQQALFRAGLPPTRLELEITEGLLLEDSEAVVTTMQRLRAIGVRMVLDDFGTAHSNLSYLCGFPFDAVKIDRSFLRALNREPQARALVEAILSMARAIGLDVVGEGVETEDQLALLRHLNCRWVQGFLLGRPAGSEQIRDWIWRHAADQVRTAKHPSRPGDLSHEEKIASYPEHSSVYQI